MSKLDLGFIPKEAFLPCKNIMQPLYDERKRLETLIRNYTEACTQFQYEITAEMVDRTSQLYQQCLIDHILKSEKPVSYRSVLINLLEQYGLSFQIEQYIKAINGIKSIYKLASCDNITNSPDSNCPCSLNKK